jgi:hypothetical protein
MGNGKIDGIQQTGNGQNGDCPEINKKRKRFNLFAGLCESSHINYQNNICWFIDG